MLFSSSATDSFIRLVQKKRIQMADYKKKIKPSYNQ